MTRTMTAKTARTILRYARALPILKAPARARAARAAREWLARGYTPTTTELLVPIDWDNVRRALAVMSVADMPIEVNGWLSHESAIRTA